MQRPAHARGHRSVPTVRNAVVRPSSVPRATLPASLPRVIIADRAQLAAIVRRGGSAESAAGRMGADARAPAETVQTIRKTTRRNTANRRGVWPSGAARIGDCAMPAEVCGVTRPIRIECYADRLVVLSDRNPADSKVIRLGPHTASSVHPFVSAIWGKSKAGASPAAACTGGRCCKLGRPRRRRPFRRFVRFARWQWADGEEAIVGSGVGSRQWAVGSRQWAGSRFSGIQSASFIRSSSFSIHLHLIPYHYPSCPVLFHNMANRLTAIPSWTSWPAS